MGLGKTLVGGAGAVAAVTALGSRSLLLPSLVALPPSPSTERCKAREAAELIDFLGLGRYADDFIANPRCPDGHVRRLPVRRAFDPSDYYRNCDELALQDPASRSGSLDVTVHQRFIPDDVHLHECNGIGAEQCYLVLVASETLAVHGSVPITFLVSSPK